LSLHRRQLNRLRDLRPLHLRNDALNRQNQPRIRPQLNRLRDLLPLHLRNDAFNRRNQPRIRPQLNRLRNPLLHLRNGKLNRPRIHPPRNARHGSPPARPLLRSRHNIRRQRLSPNLSRNRSDGASGVLTFEAGRRAFRTAQCKPPRDRAIFKRTSFKYWTASLRFLIERTRAIIAGPWAGGDNARS
jgi:hypothetical protein